MIGAHNTFTYLKTNLFMELFSFLWRCQDKSIDDLYNNYNVNFFDIRICKKRQLFKKEFIWRTAHGLVSFNKTFDNISELFLYMKMYYADAQYRIVLERCSKKEINEFYKQLEPWLKNDGQKLKEYNYNCSWIGIKNPWKCIYKNLNLYPKTFNDYCCKIFNLNPDLSIYENIKRFNIKYIIKKWANIYNPKLTTEQIKDKNTVYFMDFS